MVRSGTRCRRPSAVGSAGGRLTARRRADLRHGTTAAYVAGCVCKDCREHQRIRVDRKRGYRLSAAAIMRAMPRADRLSLNADGLRMPSVDHLSNNGSLNVLLDRTFSGLPAGLPDSKMLIGLFTNLGRG